MKRLLLLFMISLFSLTTYAQDCDYNHWSVELSGGATAAREGLAEGYGQNAMDFGFGRVSSRYMINDKFGIQFGVAYHNFKNGKRNIGRFHTGMLSLDVEGAMNLRNLFGLQDWSNTVGFLGHFGIGYATMNYRTPNVRKFAHTIGFFSDNTAYVKLGLTPQVKLSNRILLFSEFSISKLIRQDYTIDGTDEVYKSTEKWRSTIFDLSVGLSVYLGSHEKHIDWKNPEDCKTDGEDFEELDSRLTAVEKRDPEVINNYNTEEHYDYESLLEKGRLTVQFAFDKDYPQTYSLTQISYVRDYMSDNTDARILITGYADEFGAEDYNNDLSLRRAEHVKSILVASGIEADRLEVDGGGEDMSVDKDSAEARQIIRRVTFKLIDGE